jgi:Na+/H+ antiporter NhaD/arsenite permease-like protein
VFNACGGGDILFFAGLFVMVGGLNAAGVLDWFALLIEKAGQGNNAYELLALMWMAGFTTIFLNAGPSTAFFIPVASQMSYYIPGHSVWWALSLGVLAGSSAALTGATAGLVASSQLDKAIKEFPEMASYIPSGRALDFKEFLRWGFPIMIVFLTLSTFYILLIAPD